MSVALAGDWTWTCDCGLYLKRQQIVRINITGLDFIKLVVIVNIEKKEIKDILKMKINKWIDVKWNP